ncbi:hypothetical protein BN2537_13527 [Streptomyces venezuelae]|nr:hypothetical protein BN2537_13527 [Streptomyces venezuelae]
MDLWGGVLCHGARASSRVMQATIDMRSHNSRHGATSCRPDVRSVRCRDRGVMSRKHGRG